MRPPHFWSAGLDPYSRESAPILRFLLTPFAALYATVTKWKIASATPEKVSVPVICIGNVTSGGSGKTPIVAALCELLAKHAIPATSLSREYGGNLSGPLKVDPGKHTALQVGDEPLLLAQHAHAWIGRDKVVTAKAICKTETAAIILDDGHQNPALHKDITFVVIDAGAPFGNGYVIPKGPLREPVSTSLQRADGIILMGKGEMPDSVAASRLPVFRAHLQHTEALPKGPLLAFAGIGRPERFFEHLRMAGATLSDSVAFSDHHQYSKAALQRLRAFADVHEATLVTTEKDFVRLPIEERAGITPIRVRANFEDEHSVLEHLRRKLNFGVK